MVQMIEVPSVIAISERRRVMAAAAAESRPEVGSSRSSTWWKAVEGR